MASGSVGLQAGAEVAEVILMIRSQRGADAMLSNSFKVGIGASVAQVRSVPASGPDLGHSGILPVKGIYGGPIWMAR